MRNAAVVAVSIVACTSNGDPAVPSSDAGIAPGTDAGASMDAPYASDAARPFDSGSTLQPCGTTPGYSVFPMVLTDFSLITPLGNINPPAHTAPTDHLYFAYTPTSTKLAYAPGDVHIVRVDKKVYLATNVTDVKVSFSPCKEITSYYDHIVLDAAIDSQITSYGACVEYTAGSTQVRSCTAEPLDIVVPKGTLMGTGGTSGNLDFGARDNRVNLSFINSDAQKRYGNIACPLDYFTPEAKATLEGLMGGYDGTKRTELPKCGKIDYDLAATARGLWVLPGQKLSDERNLLTLAPHNYRDGKQVIGVGPDPDSATDALAFVPTTSGLVNRDFAQVKADGNVYCYDTFINARTGPAVPGLVVLLKMTGDTALTYERQKSAACGAGPWTMTSAAQAFIR